MYPDYMIYRTIAEEHKQHQLRYAPYPDLLVRRPLSREVSQRLTAIRRQISVALHAIADRIHTSEARDTLQPAARIEVIAVNDVNQPREPVLGSTVRCLVVMKTSTRD